MGNKLTGRERQVHAWVWMSNHYHLLVETPEVNLVKGMTWFQTTCTTRFNARHRLRGHLYGPESFREWLLEQAGELLGLRSRSRKNYHGDEIKAHGETEARALLAAGLTKAGITAAELSELPKSDRRKVVIAAEIRKRTVMPLAWIAQQLHIGTPAHVSHACRRHSRFRLS